jgi:hypothetical protein
MTILDAIQDPQLFRPLFKNLDTWRTWLVVLKALFALPMTADELLIFTQLTGRTTPPREPVHEGWFIKGRRAGGSFIVALIAVFLACFGNYKPYLAVGERGIVMITATDRKQARVIMRYLSSIIQSVPMLAAMIVRHDAETIELDNSIIIEITTANYRTIRGYPFGVRKNRAIPPSKSSPPCGRPWRRFPERCCSASPAPTNGAAPSTTPINGTMEKTIQAFW